MPTPNPFDAMRQACDRIKEVADKLDLEVLNVAFVAEPDGSNIVNVFFGIKPEAVKTLSEIQSDRENADFEALVGGIEFEQDEDGNLVIKGADSEDAPEEVEEELSEDDIKLAKKKEDIQKNLRKWAQGQDE